MAEDAASLAAVRQVLLELGDEATNLLAPFAYTSYQSYADKGRIDPRLQFLYCKRQMIDVLLGHGWQRVTVKMEQTEDDLSDLSKNLQALRTNCQDEIDGFEAQDRASRPPAIGTLTQTSPRLVSPGMADPNSGFYRGDPLNRYP
jgi:hypothetical protein